mmetsp:Transcript_32863/g.49583  ORF Transcript_32863/g.49583 Transcript_32863/m.49583 type:complete len:329 (-) Transcript_32863:140-1126(-)|eukprot:CAMPEP_0178929844 /NCGR_PEP_ID=MMETSP0786-20121207/20873_1 /TAXON_ID=186022 /ORGANISM="Thalassionema frauenfeldii, Strain CCMP 1798" /LENGTH=328 /DNA_ID=CAMNT_0020606241 /DNA_START=63 /DNA_END=1049 /DNA_ORIENTATION=+
MAPLYNAPSVRKPPPYLQNQNTKAQHIPTNSNGIFDEPIFLTQPGTRRNTVLPLKGSYYGTELYTPMLGVMFFKPADLRHSLFRYVENKDETLQELDERPVVAFITDDSPLQAADVRVGHVLIRVNDVEVNNPRHACQLIKEGPRPLPLVFFAPTSLEITLTEGSYMVKYDTNDTVAPNGLRDWKYKYVVVGGLIAQPWMMNMYRSKAEYDIAVVETQSRRPVSVKVKQFSLKAARVMDEGVQVVKYKNELQPRKYIVLLDASQYPIKISAPTLDELAPILQGIRSALPRSSTIRMSSSRRSFARKDGTESTQDSRGSMDSFVRPGLR